MMIDDKSEGKSATIAENILIKESTHHQFDITVIIPHFEAADLCLGAIASIDAGPYTVEVIVIDDLTPYHEYQRLRSNLESLKHKDLQLRLIRLACNQGAYSARLIAAKHASGNYTKLLDQDDVLIEGALELEYREAIKTRADITMSGWLEQWGYFDGNKFVSNSEIQCKAPNYSEPTLDFILKGGVHTSASLYKTEILTGLKKVVGWNPTLSDDWVIFGQALLESKRFTTLSQNVYSWRHHDKQQSKDTGLAHANEFYLFMLWYLAQLEDRVLLTDAHANAMATCLTKNAIQICWLNSKRWSEISTVILSLDPKLRKSIYWGRVLNWFCTIMGIRRGVINYVKIKRLLDSQKLEDSK
jgi:glycosyltransferase involved in cell wall biosynthesis